MKLIAFKQYLLLTTAFLGLLSLESDFCLAHEWTDTRTDQKFEGEIEGAHNGIVVIKTTEGEIKEIPLDALTTLNQRYAIRNLGIELIDMTGVWRSDTGTYYAISEGRRNKVYVSMLDSPSVLSIEGSLKRKGKRIKSEQWLVALKNDPIKKVRTASVEIFLTPDGRVRIRYDYIYLNKKGFEYRARKKITSAFVKIDYREIPAKILARHFPKFKTKAERRNAFIEKMIYAWLADTASKHFDPNKSNFSAVIRVALSRVSDAIIRSGLRELFPSFSAKEILVLQKTIRIFLDNPSKEELAADELKESIKEFIKEEAPDLSDKVEIIDFFYDVHTQRRLAVGS